MNGRCLNFVEKGSAAVQSIFYFSSGSSASCSIRYNDDDDDKDDYDNSHKESAYIVAQWPFIIILHLLGISS